MSEQLDRLGRQLDAIDLAIAEARAQTDPERRAHLLGVVSRASTAAREEYEAAVEEDRKRPALRIIKGGLSTTAAPVAAGIAALAIRARKHPAATAAAGTALAATALGALLVLTQDHTRDWTAPPPPSAAGQTPTTPSPGPPDTPTPPAAHSPVRAVPATPPPYGTPPHSPASVPPVLRAAFLSLVPSGPRPSPATSPPASSVTPPGSASMPPSSPPATTASSPSGLCLGLRVRPVLVVHACRSLS